jgi:hypothetical protein
MATITSIQTGDWHATGTWVGDSIPANNDLVVIAHGHKVTLSTNIQSAITDDITIDGNLHFADGGKMHLNGRMTVNNTSNSNNTAGEFVTDSTSSGSLLSMVGGTEIKISGDNAAQHGILITDRKWCGVDIQGSEPTLVTQLSAVGDYEDVYLTVDSVTNFTAGDLISVYEREIHWTRNADECLKVHDIDSANQRIYVRKFIGPTATIISSSGATILVDVTEAKQFRVGYKLVFGAGNNRNALAVTDISGGTITLASNVAGSVDGATVYESGIEIYHNIDAYVRRTATTTTAAITGSEAQRVISVASASDLSVGDEITLESRSDTVVNYTSGSESNHWRHNLLYTISGISGNDITVSRDIVYDSVVGCYVIRMTRDVVIKACAANGDEVADGDEATARVFFSVKYWVVTEWYNAATRRIKIKYVRFKNLGYNTYDSTNFRAGVTIGGYNGRYSETHVGSSHTNATIHTSNGISQTGENYVDGCAITAYSLCSNPSRDGDDYPSLCIRHPYGSVDRNCVIVGTGRGYWRWSSGYFSKSTGHISMVSNLYNITNEASYADYNFLAYYTARMSEDYGCYFVNLLRQTDRQLDFGVGYIDNQVQNYAYRFGGTVRNPFIKRLFADKYRQIFYFDTDIGLITIMDSQLTPNLWDQTRKIYGDGQNGIYYTNNAFMKYGSSYNEYNSVKSNNNSIVRIVNNRFGIDGFPIIVQGETAIFKEKSNEWRLFWTQDNEYGGSGVTDTLFIQAGTVVKLEASFKITTEYDGTAAIIDAGDYPRLEAQFGPYGQQGGYKAGTSSTVITDPSANTGANGWNAQVQFDSGCVGAFQTKSLLIPMQPRDYFLTYGLILRDNDLSTEESFMRPIKVSVSKPHSFTTNKTPADSISKVVVNVYDSGAGTFGTRKKRISGRI